MCAKLLQSCPPLRLYGLQPNRLLYPWDSPGKNIGIGCHALLQGWHALFPHCQVFPSPFQPLATKKVLLIVLTQRGFVGNTRLFSPFFKSILFLNPPNITYACSLKNPSTPFSLNPFTGPLHLKKITWGSWSNCHFFHENSKPYSIPFGMCPYPGQFSRQRWADAARPTLWDVFGCAGSPGVALPKLQCAHKCAHPAPCYEAELDSWGPGEGWEV